MTVNIKIYWAVLISVILLLSIDISGCHVGKHVTNESWVVTSFKFGNSISAFDENQARRYINKKIVISKNKVIIFGDTCLHPSIETEKVNSFYFLRNECAESDISIIPKDSVYVTMIKCISAPIYGNADSLNFNCTIIKLNENEIIVPVNGVYFILMKQ